MSAAGIVAEQADQGIHCLSPVAPFSFSIFEYLSLTRCVFGVALGYTARLLFAIPLVSNAPHRSYTVEDFTDLINARLQQLERRKEAQQHYGSLLVVLRQQVDAYRQRRTAS